MLRNQRIHMTCLMTMVLNRTCSNSDVCLCLFNTYCVQRICARELQTNQTGPVLPQGVPVWEDRHNWECHRISEAFLPSLFYHFWVLVCSRLPFWLFAAICCSLGGNHEHLGQTSGFPDVVSPYNGPDVVLAEGPWDWSEQGEEDFLEIKKLRVWVFSSLTEVL